MKIILSFGVALLLSIAATTNIQAQTADTTVTVKVKGITCGTDLNMIQTNIENLAGVNRCVVVKQGTVTSFDITYDPQAVTEQDINTTIEGTGSCKSPDDRLYKVKKKK